MCVRLYSMAALYSSLCLLKLYNLKHFEQLVAFAVVQARLRMSGLVGNFCDITFPTTPNQKSTMINMIRTMICYIHT